MHLPQKWVEKLAILIQFMTMHTYKEEHSLSFQDHALCVKKE